MGVLRRAGCARRWFVFLAVIIVTNFALAKSGSQNQPGSAQQVSIAPPAGWVKPQSARPPAKIPESDTSGGVYYMLVDKQTRFAGTRLQRYKQYANIPLNQNGVEDVSQINIPFDPSYQTLTLHTVQVIRNGRVIDQLSHDRIKLLQVEQELDDLIYNGRLNANILLDDVRINDVVAYSYTISGNNPAFAGHYSGGFELQWAVPVQQLYARLLWDKHRPLHIKNFGKVVKPKKTVHPDVIEYVWQARDLQPLHSDGNLPDWYDPYGWVQFSEYGNWTEVINWGQPFFKVEQTDVVAIQPLLEQIVRDAGSAEEQIVKVLNFIQDEIRYTGIEYGANSYIPSKPAEVIQRRYGDCKDKTYLMLSMLHSLGIQAAPALVNTRFNKGIRDYHPTATGFDHVIVQVRLDNDIYWLDPTLLHQKGNLEHIYQPDYGYALVLDKQQQDLVPMTARRAANKKSIVEEYDLTAGINEAGLFRIKTTFEGRWADYMRNRVRTRSKEEIQKDHINYYAHNFPGIKTQAEFTVEDDETSNRLIMHEAYVIPGIWERNETEKRLEVYFEPTDIDDYIKLPERPLRTMPFRMAHPNQVSVKTIVKLPEGWNVNNRSTRIEHPAFEFARDIEYQQDKYHITLHYVYRTLQDHVSPEQIADYIKKVGMARDLLGYSIYMYDESTPMQQARQETGNQAGNGSANVNWVLLMLGVFEAIILVGAAVLLYRYQPAAGPQAAAADTAPPKYVGIRGWLLLPALGIILTPLRIGYDFLTSLEVYGLSNWQALTTVGTEAYDPYWLPYLLFALLGNIAMFILALLVLVMFFRRKRLLPWLYIGFIWFSVLVHSIDVFLGSEIEIVSADAEQELPRLFVMYFTAVLWSLYFLVSERVRNTFTR